MIAPEQPVKVIRIEPDGASTGVFAALRELWEYRGLVLVLTGRDIRVRYKQTFAGVAWAFVQPFMSMVVFTLFFGQLAKMPSDGVPYPLFSFAALLPWQYFARAMTEGSAALLSNAGIITKVYFPREILPMSTVACGLVDFAIGIGFMLLLMAYFDYYPSWTMFWILPLLGLSALLALAFSFWLSSAAAIYRDVGFIVPYFVQLLMFSAPVIYPTSLVSEKWRFVYQLNPIVLVIDGFRWAVLGSGTPPSLLQVLSTTGIVLLLLASGYLYFRYAARLVADKV